jgi:group I intron endonuclease
MTKQRFGCIYRLTNLITKKTYIGKSVNFKSRMSGHKHSMKKAKTYLSKSINKHGWDNFKKEIIIDDVPEEDLSNLEISYIEVENTMCPNGYNLTLGGEGNIGWKPSKETREKMKQTQLLRQANRDQVGCVKFDKRYNKYQATGPSPESKYIGLYFTKEKAEKALINFLKMGECIESDRTQRKNGTGSIRKTKNGKRYEAKYTKNKKISSKTFNTKEECEEWLNTELKL